MTTQMRTEPTCTCTPNPTCLDHGDAKAARHAEHVADGQENLLRAAIAEFRDQADRWEVDVEVAAEWFEWFADRHAANRLTFERAQAFARRGLRDNATVAQPAGDGQDNRLASMRHQHPTPSSEWSCGCRTSFPNKTSVVATKIEAILNQHLYEPKQGDQRGPNAFWSECSSGDWRGPGRATIRENALHRSGEDQHRKHLAALIAEALQ